MPTTLPKRNDHAGADLAPGQMEQQLTKPPKDPPSSRQSFSIGGGKDLLLRFGQRLLKMGLLLLALIWFISLAVMLANAGGYQGFGEALPLATDYFFAFLRGEAPGQQQAITQMLRALPKSIGLLLISLAIGVTVGLLLGAWAAVKRKTRLSSFLITLSVLGVSTPSYVAAMFMIWFIVWGFKTWGVRLLPVYGFGWDERLIMPALVLASRPMANMMQLSYSALIDIFDADFVRTAHSKGLRPAAVFWRHILRNAGVPLLTTAGVAFRFSLAMLPVVEYIFTWPGIGLELLTVGRSPNAAALTIVMVMPLAVLFTVTNLLMDSLYEIIDPRLRGSLAGELE